MFGTLVKNNDVSLCLLLGFVGGLLCLKNSGGCVGMCVTDRVL